jgi:hypothetical protein
LLRQSTRSVSRDGREFVLCYNLTVRDTEQGPECCIQASLKEKSERGTERETGCSVEMSSLKPEATRKIFEIIAGAEDPVFPVHVPEIVRDQLSASARVEPKPGAN